MTDDEIVTLGSFCETLLCSDAWRVIVEQFEQNLFQHMMTTKPHAVKEREGIYAQYTGVQDFLAHMKAIIAEKEKLLAPEPTPEWKPLPDDHDD